MREPPGHPFPNVTIAGRLLILLTIVFSAGLFVEMVLWINEHGPSGSYPLVFFLVAIAPFAALFFGLGILVFRLLGLKFKKEPESEEEFFQVNGTEDETDHMA